MEGREQAPRIYVFVKCFRLILFFLLFLQDAIFEKVGPHNNRIERRGCVNFGGASSNKLSRSMCTSCIVRDACLRVPRLGSVVRDACLRVPRLSRGP